MGLIQIKNKIMGYTNIEPVSKRIRRTNEELELQNLMSEKDKVHKELIHLYKLKDNLKDNILNNIEELKDAGHIEEHTQEFKGEGNLKNILLGLLDNAGNESFNVMGMNIKVSKITPYLKKFIDEKPELFDKAEQLIMDKATKIIDQNIKGQVSSNNKKNLK